MDNSELISIGNSALDFVSQMFTNDRLFAENKVKAEIELKRLDNELNKFYLEVEYNTFIALGKFSVAGELCRILDSLIQVIVSNSAKEKIDNEFCSNIMKLAEKHIDEISTIITHI